MFGKKKNKYYRHLTIRISVGILLLLFVIQLLALGINAFGFFVTSLVDDASGLMQVKYFLEVNMEPDVFLEAAELKEKTPEFIIQEKFLRSFVKAMNGQVERLMVFIKDNNYGYLVMTDIIREIGEGQSFHTQEDLPEHDFLEELDQYTSGLLDSAFSDTESNSTDEFNLDMFNQKIGKEISTVLFGNPEFSEIVFPGKVMNADGTYDVTFLILVDPLEIIMAPLINISFLAIVTVLSTLLLLVLLIFWINRRVVSPLKKIKQAAVDFTTQTKQNEDPGTWNYEDPVIKTRDEIQELGDTVCDMASEIKQTVGTIVDATREQERVGAELDLAARIQNSALPKIFPAFPDHTEFDIYASMDPAREVGGDFYDFFLVDDTHLYISIADVSGKGIPASLFMMSSMLILSGLAKEGMGPAEILSRANNQIARNNKADMFVTAWIGILDLESGVIRAANAGHEYPAVKKGNEGFMLLKDRHGFVLGELEDMKYHEYEISLGAGDALFVYTDGVAEANNEKEEMFGTTRMLSALNKAPEASVKEILGNMSESLRSFSKDTDQFDDVTMLCVKYFGK